MSLIKSSTDIALLKKAGALLAEVLIEAEALAVEGCNLRELNTFIDTKIKDAGAKPSFLGYQGYPAASCLSLNEQVVHGIPDGRILKSGDLLGIDAGLWLEGVCVDGAITVGVGVISEENQTLLKGTKEALQAGIQAVKPSRRVGAISSAIQTVGDTYGFGIVRALTGHGVGHKVHEDPEIPNVGFASDGILLRPGMVLAIEPMFTLGTGDVVTEVDGWGILTVDNSYSAHFEHTIVVTDKGCTVLTV